MSNIGKSPTLRRTRYTPQAADPVNPAEGDFFVSNGTPRAIGPWVYFSGAWQQVSTSGSLNVVNSLTFTPQSSDPGSPTAGMVFYADGTSRAEGLWLYDGTEWIQLSPGDNRTQDFDVQGYFEVRIATTTNAPLSSGTYQAGGTLDGKVLVDGDFILLKNQSTTSENGIYIVHTAVQPTRHTSYDSAAELTRASASVTEGTTNGHTKWFQNNVLSTLADPQSWAATISAQTFTVPAGVTSLRIIGAGGGGGGGSGGMNVNNTGGASGGSGGTGSVPTEVQVTAVPGDILSITIGAGALGAPQRQSTNSNGVTGSDGSNTTVTGTGISLVFKGAEGGPGGSFNSTSDGAGQAEAWFASGSQSASGGGGGGNNNAAARAGVAGGVNSWYATTSSGGARGNISGVSSNGGGGGGGGSGFAAGANGGVGGTLSTASMTIGGIAAGGSGGGGGGGGGFGKASGSSTVIVGGGHGGSGIVRISW